jgi:hypothetical protein
VNRHDDGQVERDFAIVVGDESSTGTIDLAGVDFGDQSSRSAATGLVKAPSRGVT